jgi:AGZA family xanthine/uracil permease-like MFS transporter
VGYDKLEGNGVIYHGMALLGGGAVLAGLIMGAIAVFIIDRKFGWAAVYAGAGAVFSFFGFIHGTSLGWGNSAPVALGYVLIAGVCLVFSRKEVLAKSPPMVEVEHGMAEA